MSAEKLKLEVLLAGVDKLTRPLKSIRDGSTATAKALKAARDQLKELNAQQDNITAFKKAEKDAAIAANTFKSVQDRVRQLKEEIAKVPAPTAAMAKELRAATREADELKARHAGLIDKQQRLFAQMKAGGIDINNLAHHSRDLATRQIEATQATKRLSDALDVENQKLKKVHAARAQYDKSMAVREKLAGAGAKAMIAGAAINAAAGVPVIAYAKAEDSATQLRVALMQSGGKIHEQFKDINSLAEKLGNRLPGTTSDYQDMMTMLIRQGMPAKAILGGLGEATAFLAVQLKMAPPAAAEFASKLQDATRATDKEMMGLMDTIQKTYYLGVDQNNMLQGFAKLSPALSILRTEGLAAAKALAPLLVLADQSGMVGEAAGNAYRKIFQMSLDARKLAKGNAELHGTGIKLDFSNGKGESGGIDKIYAELAKLKGVDTQRRLAALKKIFGDDAETLQALTIMIEKGAEGYRDVQAKMEAQAAIQERVNLQLKTLKNLWDAATGTFTNALVAFGESIAPELHATAELLGRIAEKTQAWSKENPNLAAGLMHVVKWAGMAALVIGGLLLAVSAIAIPLASTKLALAYISIQGGTLALVLGNIAAYFKGLGYVIGFAGAKLLSLFPAIASGLVWLGRIMLTNPFGLLITAALLIYTYWEPISGFFKKLWASISTAFKLGVAEIKAWWAELDFIAIGKAAMRGLADGLLGGWQWVKNAIGKVIDMLPSHANRRLDIRSPSRVFAKIGGSTMDGLENGILRARGGPLAAILDTAKRLTAAGAGVLVGGTALAGELPRIDTRPTLSPTSHAAATAPMIVQITINPAPGMDEAAIGHQVAAELQRLESQRAARARSRLTDRE